MLCFPHGVLVVSHTLKQFCFFLNFEGDMVIIISIKQNDDNFSSVLQVK
jgi:hypothetical protein